MFSMVVGICASHRFLSTHSPSPLFDLAKNDVTDNQVLACKAQVPHFHNPSNSNLWEMCFRWIIGFISPLLFLAIPSVLHLNFRLLRQDKNFDKYSTQCTDNFGRRPRETSNSLLRHYLRFCLSILWIDFLLRLPSFIHDISLWTFDNKFGDDDSTTTATTPSVDKKFVLYILTVIFPELRLIYFPIATFILLPGGRQKTRREKVVVKTEEEGSEIERDSFVVSASTVAIEVIPSLVQFPEAKSNSLDCFCFGRKNRNVVKTPSTCLASSTTSVTRKAWDLSKHSWLCIR